MTSGAEWADQARRLFDVLSAGAGEPAGPSAPGAAHGPDCRWCPVCQVAAVVRGERPEVAAALADVLTATATALRDFAEPPSAPAPAPSAADERAAGNGDAEEPPPAVQRIDIA